MLSKYTFSKMVTPARARSNISAQPQRRSAASSRLFFCNDLPLAVLAAMALFATFSKHVEDTGCCHRQHSLTLPAYVPAGFPCGNSTLRQATWMLSHPASAFLLSADPLHRCWMYVAATCVAFTWLAFIFFGAAAQASYRLQHRSIFMTALRLAPKAAALAQLASYGPTSAIVYMASRMHVIAVVHAVNSALGTRTLYLASSIADFLLFLANSYLLSTHGHATWTFAHLGSSAAATLGVPLVLTICTAICRRIHRRGDGFAALAAAAAAPAAPLTAACADVATAKAGASSAGACSAMSSGDHHPTTCSGSSCAAVPKITCAEVPVHEAFASVTMTRVSSLSLPGLSTTTAAAHISPPLVPLPAAKGCGDTLIEDQLAASLPVEKGRGDTPIDDPELWASILMLRRLLAEPIPDYKPKVRRKRISIKVGRSNPYRIESCALSQLATTASVPLCVTSTVCQLMD